MQIPVLAYHKIDQPTPDIKLRGAFTSPKNFAMQMLYLIKQNFVFYTASELIDFYKQNGAFPPKAITVTFDDGWKDNYTNAFPILRDLQIKATVFLVPSCIGQTTTKVVGDGESKREHLALTDIRAMSDYGIEFGSHTLNHKLLHQISPPETEFEIFGSKKEIENLLQKPCRVFAYPAGFFTETAQAAVKDAGYIAAFSTVYGENETVNLYALNRVEILRRNRFLFQFARTIKPLQTENV
jgi:peptidoglycan/xylan/chitin deacetylase (PgdA/CDA1 family)